MTAPRAGFPRVALDAVPLTPVGKLDRAALGDDAATVAALPVRVGSRLDRKSTAIISTSN